MNPGDRVALTDKGRRFMGDIGRATVRKVHKNGRVRVAWDNGGIFPVDSDKIRRLDPVEHLAELA